jgi:type IV secretion system protein VirD4
MTGKMVRNPAASQPAALAFLFLIGLVVSMGVGALAVLWQAHLLSAHTPWARVPGALWALRGADRVETVSWRLRPRLHGQPGRHHSSMFRQQKLHGEARWAQIGEVRKAKLMEDAGILLGRISGQFLRFGGTEHVLLEAPTRAGKGVGVVIPNLLQWPDRWSCST